MQLTSLFLGVTRPSPFTLDKAIASLFAAGEQGAWYDPSGNNTTWRRNLVTYTENFTNSNSQWPTTLGVTVTADQAVAPDGQSTADSIIEDGGNTKHSLTRVTTAVGSTAETYCWSIHVKRASGTRNVILYNFGFNNATARFNLTDKTATIVSGGTSAACSLQELADGWFRLIFSDVATSTQQGIYVGLLSGTTETYQGNSTSGIYAWGFQYERGTTPTAYQRIITPEITYLSTVQAQPLLFQDSAGTLPVTEVEQPVGLMLDRRKGLALGAELVPDVSFDDSGAWTAQTGWSVASGKATYTDQPSGVQYLETSSNVSLLANKWYEVRYTISGIASGDALFSIFDKAAATNYFGVYVSHTENREYVRRILVPSNANGLRIYANSAGLAASWSIDSFSVKLLDGNHAYQTTSSARPHLRSRYNLLTYSEDYSNAVWVKTNLTRTTGVADPSGGTNATTLTASGGSGRIYIGVSVTANTNYTGSIYIRRRTGTGDINWESFTVGVGALITTTGSWTRVQITGSTPATTAYFGIRIATVGDEIDIFGADFRPGNAPGTYQRIAATPTLSQPPTYATTSTMGGEVFRPYLWFDAADGTGDSLRTADIAFTATDEMAVCVGQQKMSDATTGVLLEISAIVTNDGSFALTAPSSSGTNKYDFNSRGTANSSAVTTSSAFSAPHLGVVTGQADISSDTCTLRVNGASAGTSATDQGTGNYGTWPMFIGRRNSTTLHYTGQVYGIIVRNKTLLASELTTVESYIAGKTGVTL